MSECPSCGGALAPDDKFCAGCGAPVSEPDPATAPEPPETPACAACGGEIAADARFCGHCGAAVAGADEPIAEDEPTVVDEPTLVAEEPTLVAEEPTLVAEEATLVAEASTEALTPVPAGGHSSRSKKIGIIVGVAAIAAVIAGVVLWRGGDDPPPQTPSDASAPAYEYTYDETTPATGYDDSSGSEAVPDMEADALSFQALYGFWSGEIYVQEEMASGGDWEASELGFQTAYVSLGGFEGGSWGEFTVEPTSSPSFTGDVTDISIDGDVATLSITYTTEKASADASATLQVSLQDGYSLLGFYEDDASLDSNWISWRGDVELHLLEGE